MEEKSPKQKSKFAIISIITTVLVISLAIIFGILLAVNHREPGKIVFNDTATEETRDFVSENITDIELEKDVTIGTATETTRVDTPGYILYNILLPVTDFYSTETNISSEDAQNGTLVSIWDLNAEQRLLALDNNYFFDNYTSGAFFEYYTVSGENSNDIEKVANKLSSSIAEFPNENSILSLAQTGVTALSRRMNTKLDQVGDAKYFSTYITPFLRQFDFIHTSNESSFSNLANGSNICSKPAMIDVLTDIGLNIVELTGNHNQDCGDQDAIATIEQYHDLGIHTFGGGISDAEAAIPLEITEKSTSITLLGYNLSTGGYTLDNTPGANFYTEEKAKSDIAAAKERGDFIIVDIQYYECNEYASTTEDTTCDAANSSAGDQIGFFRHLIDMGANIVIGTAAHQPQTYEIYRNGEIYYGLGNLFFDQSAWPGTTRSLVLVHYFYKNKLLQTRIVPTIYDNNFQTRLMDSADAQAFLQRLINVRPAQD